MSTLEWLLLSTQTNQRPSNEDDGDVASVKYVLHSPHSNIGSIEGNYVLESGERIVHVALDNTNIANGTPRGLKNLNVMTNYSVATGHTAKLFCILTSNTANNTFTIKDDATFEANAGTTKYNYTGNQFDSGEKITVAPEWSTTPITFAAGKFITITCDTGGGASMTIDSLVIVETPV